MLEPHKAKPNPSRRELRHRLADWARLVSALVAIWLFIAVIAPLLQRTPWINRVHAVAHETGIDATGLFYTETEVFSDAELFLREAQKNPADTVRAN